MQQARHVLDLRTIQINFTQLSLLALNKELCTFFLPRVDCYLVSGGQVLLWKGHRVRRRSGCVSAHFGGLGHHAGRSDGRGRDGGDGGRGHCVHVLLLLLLLVLLQRQVGEVTLVVRDGGQVRLDNLVRKLLDVVERLRGHERGGEGSGSRVCTFGLDGRVDAQRVDELHEAVEVVLFGNDGARVDEVNQSLNEADFRLRQDEADVVDAVERRRLKEELQEGAGDGKEHLVCSDNSVLAVNGHVDKVLSVAQQLGLLQHLHLVSATDQLLLSSSQNHLMLGMLGLLVVQLVRLSRQGDVRRLRLQGGELWRRRASDDDPALVRLLLGDPSAPGSGSSGPCALVRCALDLHLVFIRFKALV